MVVVVVVVVVVVGGGGGAAAAAAAAAAAGRGGGGIWQFWEVAALVAVQVLISACFFLHSLLAFRGGAWNPSESHGIPMFDLIHTRPF